MHTAHETALAFLMTQHNVEQKAVDHAKALEPKVTAMSLVPKASKKITAKKEAAPIHHNGQTTCSMGLVLPEKGSLNAHDFLLAMRNAGRRIAETGVAFTDQREVRNDQIKAIHGFCGYDAHESFGSQDIAARQKAMRDIRGLKVSGLSRQEQKNVNRSLSGFVAGCPDHTKRHVANLQARATAAVDAMIAHEKDAANESRSEYDRTLSEGLAAVERERLQVILADIKALGF